MLDELALGGPLAVNGFWRAPTTARRSAPQETSDRQPQRLRPPIWPSRELRICALLSACEPVAGQHRPRLHIGCEEPRLREGVRRTWCQSLVGHHGREGGIQQPLRGVVGQELPEEEDPCLSRTRWFSRVHLLRDRHGRQRTPGRIHDVPRPLKSGNLCGDGHGRREDGHTDKSGTREEAGGGDGVTRAPGRGGKRTAGGEKKGKR